MVGIGLLFLHHQRSLLIPTGYDSQNFHIQAGERLLDEGRQISPGPPSFAALLDCKVVTGMPRNSGGGIARPNPEAVALHPDREFCSPARLHLRQRPEYAEHHRHLASTANTNPKSRTMLLSVPLRCSTRDRSIRSGSWMAFVSITRDNPWRSNTASARQQLAGIVMVINGNGDPDRAAPSSRQFGETAAISSNT